MKTKPAIPAAIRAALVRAHTLQGVAPCAQAPVILPTYVGSGRHATGYRTMTPRAAGARTREAIRTDVVRLRGVR